MSLLGWFRKAGNRHPLAGVSFGRLFVGQGLPLLADQALFVALLFGLSGSAGEPG